jgi:hypothetical protein
VAEGFQHQLRRADAVGTDALRGEQQFDGFKNVRLIVGNQDADLFLLSDGQPPT